MVSWWRRLTSKAALGPGQRRRSLVQAALGVPHDVGLQLVAMLLELQLAIDDEGLAAQIEERLVDGADVGRGFLDDAAQFLEAARRLGANVAELAIDRH